MLFLIPHVVYFNSTVKIDLLPYSYGKHQGLVIGHYGSGGCQGRRKSKRVTKGVGIPRVYLLYLQLFVAFTEESEF